MEGPFLIEVRHWRTFYCAMVINGIPMKDDLFRELEASVREGDAILRGERSPSPRSSWGIPTSRASAIPFDYPRWILRRCSGSA